jgi:hypothetical protein
MAQVRTGNIYGKVFDPDGKPLAGVIVTLSGTLAAPAVSMTSKEGVFRFISIPPAKDYSIKAKREGFKTIIRENIIVVVGINVNLTLTMEAGMLEEEIRATALTPVVDPKRTNMGSNFIQEILQHLPTARDPWVILQMAPSILVDRENVGGSHSGQQSSFSARGTDYSKAVWNMDGVVITDPSSPGGPSSFFDFDSFEEIQVTFGGADVTVQTGGVAINIVTQRGGNKVSLGGRAYITDEKFQAENLTDKLRAEGIQSTNKIRSIKDLGFNLGFPLVKNKAWLYLSYGLQDIKADTIYGTPDDMLLTNYFFKFNLQIIPQNRFEAFYDAAGKNKWGTGATAELPNGYFQGNGKYHFGNPILKIQDEHMFRENLFVSVKYAFVDSAFSLIPMIDLDFEKLAVFNDRYNIWEGSTSRSYYEQPGHQFSILANYFHDNLFRSSHDLKFGIEYADRRTYSAGGFVGNVNLRKVWSGYGLDESLRDLYPGIMGVNVARASWSDSNVVAFATYFSDTITLGNFNLFLGLRYDRQTPSLNPVTLKAVDRDSPVWKDNFTPGTIDAIDRILPGLKMPEIKATAADGSAYSWKFLSPRLGLTWDIFGDGKTILKLSGAMYGDFMGTEEAKRWMQGGTAGWMNFWWLDENNDWIVDFAELYWHYILPDLTPQLYRVYDDAGTFQGDLVNPYGMYGGYDPLDPYKTTDSRQSVDSDAGSSRTSELMLNLEREILPDFLVSINATYRKYDHFRWSLAYYPEDAFPASDYPEIAAGDRVENQDWYMSAGKPPSMATDPKTGASFDTKEAAKYDWYVRKSPYIYTDYRWVKRRPDYYQDYYGFDLIFNKRLSNKWMLTGSFTWQRQAQHYGDNGWMNKTNLWALDNQPYAPYMGGESGKIDQYCYSRWMFKLGGFFQLPYGFNASFTFNAREGWIIIETFLIVDYRLPNYYSRSSMLYMSPFGSNRLPAFYKLDLRLEKVISSGDFGRIYLMADIFNVLNSAIINRRYQKDYGTVIRDDFNYWQPNSRFNIETRQGEANEILNPRVLRLGVRFTF